MADDIQRDDTTNEEDMDMMGDRDMSDQQGDLDKTLRDRDEDSDLL